MSVNAFKKHFVISGILLQDYNGTNFAFQYWTSKTSAFLAVQNMWTVRISLVTFFLLSFTINFLNFIGCSGCACGDYVEVEDDDYSFEEEEEEEEDDDEVYEVEDEDESEYCEELESSDDDNYPVEVIEDDDEEDGAAQNCVETQTEGEDSKNCCRESRKRKCKTSHCSVRLSWHASS